MTMAVPIRVLGVGPLPCDVMIVGERPGEVEAEMGFPFAGPSGALQDKYLQQNSMHRRRCYITNLVKTYTEGNLDPTPAEIAAEEGFMYAELLQVRPRFILAVGAFATRWFLGDVDMDTVHGLPRHSDRTSAIIIPCFHPAYGLRDADANTLVWWDYRQAAQIISGRTSAEPVVDQHPSPVYLDGDVPYHDDPPAVIALDVEGPIEVDQRGDYWGFSLCLAPGSAAVFRRSHPNFQKGVALVNEIIRTMNPIVVLHNGIGLDIEVLRLMGVDLTRARLYDTMVAAFFLRVEPQGLKPLSRRHCGMEMRTYEEVIGDVAIEKQIDYLLQVADAPFSELPKPEKRLIHENDGTSRIYTPQPVQQRASKILADWGTACGDPLLCDPADRWRKVDSELRHMVEGLMGPLPVATLDDVALPSAVNYSGRDPDATLRLYSRLKPLIAAQGLDDRLQLDLDLVSVFEEMQATGFIADRGHFERLSAAMWAEMMRIGAGISHRYNDDKPFNPMSQPQVSALAASRRLKGAKKTKTGKVSTSKKSMEHLRTVDAAMDDIFNWREHEKVRDSFAEPILDRIPDGVDTHPIRCNIKLTRVTSDRISASDPNLTAIPVASDLGRQVRGGFRAPGIRPDAPTGCLLGTADLSQIEMRVMAHLSNDPLLVRLFLQDRDIHVETACLIFHLVAALVDKMKHRNPTKRAGFGVITGIQGPGLLDQLRQMGCEGWRVERFRDEVSTDVVSDWCPGGIIHEWFGIYPGVREYLAKCRRDCARDGMVREMGGFPRYLPSIWSGDPYVAAEAGRQSHSHIIQGSAQWMLRKSMRWLKPQLEALRESTGLYLRWTLQIHDEILFAFARELEPAIKSLVLEAMADHSCKLRVPVKASWGSAETWDKLEK